jgi:hypothetical protein
VHWLAERAVSLFYNETFIFSFSLDNETSRTIPLPPLEMGRKCHSQHLRKFGGRLCLFRGEMYSDAVLVAHSIWLLREHDTCSWDLHCRIDLDMLPPKIASFMHSNPSVRLLDIVDDGRSIILLRPRILTLSTPSFMLCSYDLVTKDMEKLIDGSDFVPNTGIVLRHAALYEESITTPGQPLSMM